MPSDEETKTVPPLISMPESASMPASPPVVGPYTVTVPPEISSEPLESKPSPDASIVTVPPDMTIYSETEVSSLAALMPSSRDVMSRLPPLIST